MTVSLNYSTFVFNLLVLYYYTVELNTFRF